MSRRVDKQVCGAQQEEVVLQNFLRLAELLLRLLKVKVDVQSLDEVGDRVIVLVAFLSHDPDEILELLLVLVRVPATVTAGDDGSSEVAQDPRAVGLDGVDVSGGEEHVGEGFARGFVVEEGEERPVDQPGAVLELCEGVVEEACVDDLLELVDLLHGRVPVDGEDLAGELSPGGLAFLVAVGGLLTLVTSMPQGFIETYQNAEAVEQLRGMWVDTARVLELAKLEQLVDHVQVDAVALLKVCQVLLLVAAQVGDDVLVVEQAADLAGGLLELVALLEDLVALGLELVGHVVEAVDLLVQLADEIRHVGGLEQFEQQLLLLDGLVGVFIAGEVEERVDEMAVEVGHELGEQRVLLGDICAGCR